MIPDSAAERRYSSASEYICELIREDEKRKKSRF
jgi:Arc/MetJ-type ribon-helix-helix transcriptional regulator